MVLLPAYLALLRFADTVFFYKLKVCGNPELSKSINAIFPTACPHFVSPCYILVNLTILQSFYYYYIC